MRLIFHAAHDRSLRARSPGAYHIWHWQTDGSEPGITGLKLVVLLLPGNTLMPVLSVALNTGLQLANRRRKDCQVIQNACANTGPG